MAPRPTVIGTQGYRRGLASLSVVKELLFQAHRNVPHCCTAAAANNRIGTLSDGTYPAPLLGLAFQLCLPQLPLSFCFAFQLLFDLLRHSLAETQHPSLATNP